MKKIVILYSLLGGIFYQLAFTQVIEKGKATYYANKFVGRKTANGEVYSHDGFTAAHRTIPLGTNIRVTRLDNQKSITVKVNDRCADHAGGVIDLSKGAAEALGFVRAGLTNVKLELIDEGLSPNELAEAKYQIIATKAPDMESLLPKITALNEKGFENQTVQYYSQAPTPYYQLIVGPYKYKQNATLVKQALQREGFDANLEEKQN